MNMIKSMCCGAPMIGDVQCQNCGGPGRHVKICPRCDERIEQSQATVQSWGFPAYHTICWVNYLEEIREDHVRGEIESEQRNEGDF